MENITTFNHSAISPQLPILDYSERIIRPNTITPVNRTEAYSNSIPVDWWLYSDNPAFDDATDALMEELGDSITGHTNNIRTNVRQLLVCFADLVQRLPEYYLGYMRKDEAWNQSMYQPIDISRKMVEVIDCLAEHGLAESIVGHRFALYVSGEWKSMSSRVRPTTKMAEEYLKGFDLLNIPIQPHPNKPLILLRKRVGRKKSVNVEFEHTVETLGMEDNLRQYNELMSSVHISSTNPTDTTKIEGCSNSYHRVFANRFDKGGRFYNGILQGRGKNQRKDYLIDGEQIVELDMKGSHVALAYAYAGVNYLETFGDGDPYDLGDEHWDRKLVKSTMLILFNNGGIRSSWCALRDEYTVIPESVRLLSGFRELVDNILCKHPTLTPYFSDNAEGIGLDLQYNDSRVCEAVMLNLTQQGIPVIPVHDSFITKVSDESKLREAITYGFNSTGLANALSIIEVKSRGGRLY